MATFTGFSPKVLTFFAGLEADNSKSYWQANKATWEEEVRGPMLDFLAAMPAEFQPFRMYRPNRDVRFTRDKSLYKTHVGAFSESKAGIVYYLQLSTAGLFVVSGYYMMDAGQLDRFRAAIDDEQRGTELERIIAATKERGLEIGSGGEAALKTAPRGYAKDHPRVELLRWKGITAGKDFGIPSWLNTPETVTQVEAAWRKAAPLNDWLSTHVGKGDAPPDQPSRRGR